MSALTSAVFMECLPHVLLDCGGNTIAYCSANSITLESPYHFLCRGGCERQAAWCRDHHQLRVAGEFEIKGGALVGGAGWMTSNWIVCCCFCCSPAVLQERRAATSRWTAVFIFPYFSSLSLYIKLAVCSSTHSPCRCDNLSLSPLCLFSNAHILFSGFSSQ